MKFRIPKRRKKAFAVLPTLLTLGNGMCGFGAITLVGGAAAGADPAMPFFTAGCLIFLAMLFDGLDGAAARWTNQESNFGAQLDSLSDAISFGVAPAVLMLEMVRPYGYHPRVLWVAAALYAVCALLRLARFNATPDDSHKPGEFCGLPSPGAAAVVASFPIMLFGPQLMSDGQPGPVEATICEWATRLLPVVTVGVACLMVSRIPYAHAFHRLVRGRRSGAHLIRLVFAAAVIVAFPRVTVPLLVCGYAFSPPVMALWARYRHGPPPPGPVEPVAAGEADARPPT